MIRLQKFIADCGLTSRRKAENLIISGRVSVNEEVVTVLGTKVDPRHDLVKVDEQILSLEDVQPLYFVFHKPRGVMTTVHDPEGRPTIMEYFKEISERIYPVGRLDFLSEGLIILTNDGEFAQSVLHPSKKVLKVYEVKVFGAVTPALIKELRSPRNFAEGEVRPFSVRVVKTLPRKTWLEFQLIEGRNREIRRICEEVGITVEKLKRIAIGGLSVEGLAPGRYIEISKRELLKKINQTPKIQDGKMVGYNSSKKTVKIKKIRFAEDVLPANDQRFKKFSKETIRLQREQTQKA